jgi:hypothetical protein
MLGKIPLAAVIFAAVALPATAAQDSRPATRHNDFKVAYGRNSHHGFHAGYREGYDAGYRHGYTAGDSAGASPFGALGAVLRGATYGYWSDGYRVYGGDPCYQYNDRDWEFERVC